MLEKAFADLKEAKDALAEARDKQRSAEEQASKLAQEVIERDRNFEKVL